MVHFALTNKARRIRRLRYRSGSESLTFTYTYPERKLPEEAGSSQEDTELPVVEKKEERSWMEQLEGMLDEMDPEEKGEVAYASGEQSDPQPRTGNRDGPEELTWAGAMTEGSTVDDMVTAAGLPDVAEVMEEDTETVEQSTKTNRPPTGQTSEARYEEPSESARQSDSGRNETPRDPPEELTWAGSLTEGSTADDTVAAAGHPDAEEVMQADIGEAEHSASEHPSSSGEASGGGRDVEESDAERPSRSGTTEMDGLTAHGAADRFEHSTMARDDPERDPLSSIENLTWAGPMQVGSSAEGAVAAGGHAGAAEEMQAELRESGETGGPISSTHVDDALPFTAETALVCEEDVMLPDR